MDQKCILAAFAHPDDECFGTAGILRRYADQGIKTALICATRGEVGEISDPALATPETLGQVREQELREACRIIGISDLSFLDYRDGMLAKADEVEAVGRIVRQMRRLRPQVVVTFDAKGGYGHTDHIAIHKLTISAFHKAGDPTCYPEQIREGLPPYAPQKLYLTALPVSAGRALREQLQAMGVEYRPGGNAATIPVEQMGTPDEEITTVIPLTDREFETKRLALLAHRTQMNPSSFVNRMSPEAFRSWRGAEHFVLVSPPRNAAEGIEDDLFEGVTL